MGYIDDITALQEVSFDNIRRIAYNDILKLSDKERKERYDSLNHGVGLLITDIQMKCYLYSFGRMHQAKTLDLQSGSAAPRYAAQK